MYVQGLNVTIYVTCCGSFVYQGLVVRLIMTGYWGATWIASAVSFKDLDEDMSLGFVWTWATTKFDALDINFFMNHGDLVYPIFRQTITDLYCLYSYQHRGPVSLDVLSFKVLLTSGRFLVRTWVGKGLNIRHDMYIIQLQSSEPELLGLLQYIRCVQHCRGANGFFFLILYRLFSRRIHAKDNCQVNIHIYI